MTGRPGTPPRVVENWAACQHQGPFTRPMPPGWEGLPREDIIDFMRECCPICAQIRALAAESPANRADCEPLNQRAGYRDNPRPQPVVERPGLLRRAVAAVWRFLLEVLVGGLAEHFRMLRGGR